MLGKKQQATLSSWAAEAAKPDKAEGLMLEVEVGPWRPRRYWVKLDSGLTVHIDSGKAGHPVNLRVTFADEGTPIEQVETLSLCGSQAEGRAKAAEIARYLVDQGAPRDCVKAKDKSRGVQ